MKWKEALNIYYKKNKPDCYLPRKGTKHYNDVLAMVSEAPAKKSPAKKSPAKKSPAKKSPAKKSPAKKKSNCALNNNQCKIIKGVFKDCL
jgi:topoisomerase IA-like protein